MLETYLMILVLKNNFKFDFNKWISILKGVLLGFLM